ncbi:hypothetical protein EJ05DRAFT_169578 [Pseudovirgaria hyperparasitica]|uniref:Uncharacterized protein n=1 Tax=Pseudovirgaria hyperparasitica TaxID=470096 RepID=A0A6A6VWT2_9PEZI|nr:uncharacterized protein EJ05DRAFT_169578 [Pseudovirgaria hyperparasitica]KAF2753717.1 hypothetical protein EJ05DRAFT_169578 [Pseudovirgaria hyperparasitica]
MVWLMTCFCALYHFTWISLYGSYHHSQKAQPGSVDGWIDVSSIYPLIDLSMSTEQLFRPSDYSVRDKRLRFYAQLLRERRIQLICSYSKRAGKIKGNTPEDPRKPRMSGLTGKREACSCRRFWARRSRCYGRKQASTIISAWNCAFSGNTESSTASGRSTLSSCMDVSVESVLLDRQLLAESCLHCASFKDKPWTTLESHEGRQ